MGKSPVPSMWLCPEERGSQAAALRSRVGWDGGPHKPSDSHGATMQPPWAAVASVAVAGPTGGSTAVEVPSCGILQAGKSQHHFCYISKDLRANGDPSHLSPGLLTGHPGSHGACFLHTVCCGCAPWGHCSACLQQSPGFPLLPRFSPPCSCSCQSVY